MNELKRTINVGGLQKISFNLPILFEPLDEQDLRNKVSDAYKEYVAEIEAKIPEIITDIDFMSAKDSILEHFKIDLQTLFANFGGISDYNFVDTYLEKSKVLKDLFSQCQQNE